MADATNPPAADRDAARQARLRDALRENLKRRKMQLRGRAMVAADAPAAAGAEADIETPGGPAPDPLS